MKATLTLGLLLVGGSVPALRAVGDHEGPEESAGAAVAASEADELEELHELARELEAKLERLESESEIQRLERSLEERREMRARRREFERRIEELELRRELAEEELDQRLGELDREWGTRYEAFVQELERAEEALERARESAEAEHERALRKELRNLESEGAGEAALEDLEYLFDERWRERSERYADEFDQLRERHIGLSEIEARGEAAVASTRREGREHLRQLEREIADAYHALEDFEEESEARLEIRELRGEMESNEVRSHLERDLERVEEAIMELECAEWDEEDEWDDVDECDVEDRRSDDGEHEDHDFDVESLHEVLEHLQEQIDDLREEVEKLWKAVEKEGEVAAVGGAVEKLEALGYSGK